MSAKNWNKGDVGRNRWLRQAPVATPTADLVQTTANEKQLSLPFSQFAKTGCWTGLLLNAL